MNPLKLIYPVLDALSEGRIIRKIVAVYLMVQGCLLAVTGIIGVVMILKYSFHEFVPIEGTIAGLIISLIVLFTFFILFQIHMYRADMINNLEDSPFTITPIISIYLRLVGEAYATIILAFSFSGFLAIAFTGKNFIGSVIGEAFEFLPFMESGGSTFLSGLLMLLIGALTAFFVIMITYFLAEVVIVAVDIAINTRKIAGEDGGRVRNEPPPRTPSYYSTPRAKEPIRQASISTDDI